MASMSERPGRYQRSFPGMIGALLVLLLTVAAFVAFRDINRDEPANPVEPVEYADPAEYAQGEVDYELLAPEPLPEGWMATSVRFDIGRAAWHLGMLTDEQRYVGLEQSERPVRPMVRAHVDEEAERGEDVTIDGERWQSWTDTDDDLALVRRGQDVTTLVVGRVSQETLEELIASLE